MNAPIVMNPDLDLVLERVVDVPRELVWLAWTNPEHLKKWFTPAPWTTPECEIDLRPGGIFRTVMRGPEGQQHSVVGCYLEVVPNERLVWTTALGPGYRPQNVVGASGECTEIPFTTVLTLEGRGASTKYTALAIHGDKERAKQHADMGFHEGWSAALDQLVAIAKAMKNAR